MTEIYHPDRRSAMISSDIQSAAGLLLSENVVAIPTETVYGLAGSIRSPKALRRIFEVKERPFFDPLIVHIYDLSQLSEVVSSWPPLAEFLAKKFWPGALTIVVPKASALNSVITAGLETVAVRMPSHLVARELLRSVNIPLAAPSANKFGKVSPTTAAHVAGEFGDEIFVLDGGPSELGLESTVVRVSEDRVEVLRPGLITIEALRNSALQFKRSVSVVSASSQASPGHLENHYQPKLPLIIIPAGDDPKAAAAKLGLSEIQGVEFVLDCEPRMAARTLYSSLRELSESTASFIWVQRSKLQSGDAWDAIWDRLQRASIRA